MSNLTLYHGSQNIIEKPKYGFGKLYNDYGLGFYCTESLELAKEWACPDNDFDGYANQYTLSIDGLKILDLSNEPYTILNWMAILLKFRNFPITSPIAKEAKEYLLDNFYVDVDKYDLVIGYRADDSYFSFARDFISNTISVKQLSKAMELGQLGKQVVLKSKKAFEDIVYIDAELADKTEYYTKRLTRDNNARKEYKEGNIRTTDIKDDIFILDIIRRGLRHGDKIV